MTDDLIKRLRAAHLPYGLHVEAVDRIETLKAEVTRLRGAIREASDPDFLEGAMDNVHDMDVSPRDYAEAASRAIRAQAIYSALAASKANGGTEE